MTQKCLVAKVDAQYWKQAGSTHFGMRIWFRIYHEFKFYFY